MVLDDITFEEVVNGHYESLYRFAFSLAAREQDAKDLTQETFAQLARKAGQIQDRSKIKSWLFTTLYRSFVDSRRRNLRHPEVDVEAADAEMPAHQPEAPGRPDAASALAALQRIPDIFRAPLILFYLEDHSYLEIAEILKVPPGTVMSRISRGRALLRRLLDSPPADNRSMPSLKIAVP